MSQKSLITVTICMTVIFTIWMLHGSLCEFRLNLWGAEFAVFLQCKQQENRDGDESPRQLVAEVQPIWHPFQVRE